jgi:hypothetical protein
MLGAPEVLPNAPVLRGPPSEFDCLIVDLHQALAITRQNVKQFRAERHRAKFRVVADTITATIDFLRQREPAP